MKKEKIPQRQKYTKGVKTSFIWEELDKKYGMGDIEVGVVA